MIRALRFDIILAWLGGLLFSMGCGWGVCDAGRYLVMRVMGK